MRGIGAGGGRGQGGHTQNAKEIEYRLPAQIFDQRWSNQQAQETAHVQACTPDSTALNGNLRRLALRPT